jgi:hypothetical protein
MPEWEFAGFDYSDEVLIEFGLSIDLIPLECPREITPHFIHHIPL